MFTQQGTFSALDLFTASQAMRVYADPSTPPVLFIVTRTVSTAVRGGDYLGVSSDTVRPGQCPAAQTSHDPEALVRYKASLQRWLAQMDLSRDVELEKLRWGSHPDSDAGENEEAIRSKCDS